MNTTENIGNRSNKSLQSLHAEELLETIISRSNSVSSKRNIEPKDDGGDGNYNVLDKKALGIESIDGSMSLSHQMDELFPENDEPNEILSNNHSELEELHVISTHSPHDSYTEVEDNDNDRDTGSGTEYTIHSSSPLPTRKTNKSNEIKGNTNSNTNNTPNNKPKSIIVSSTGRKYQHVLAKPVLEAGNLQLGIGKAKLYGFTDTDGKIKLPADANITTNTQEIVEQKRIHVNKVDQLHTRREIDVEGITIHDEKYSFQPTKTKEAINAMKNPRCGYDFIHRLNKEDTNSVLDRLTISGNRKGMSKSALDALEEDYNAKLDKLICPTCKKSQSFAEYIDKRRICSQCNERFIKGNVSSGMAYTKQVQVYEQKRKEKVSAIEEDMYGDMIRNRDQFKGKPVPQFIIDSAKEKRIAENKSVQGKPTINTGFGYRAVPLPVPSTTTRIITPTNRTTGSSFNTDAKNNISMDPNHYNHHPVTIINKLAIQNSNRNTLLQQTIQLAEEKYNRSANKSDNLIPSRIQSNTEDKKRSNSSEKSRSRPRSTSKTTNQTKSDTRGDVTSDPAIVTEAKITNQSIIKSIPTSNFTTNSTLNGQSFNDTEVKMKFKKLIS